MKMKKKNLLKISKKNIYYYNNSLKYFLIMNTRIDLNIFNGDSTHYENFPIKFYSHKERVNFFQTKKVSYGLNKLSTTVSAVSLSMLFFWAYPATTYIILFQNEKAPFLVKDVLFIAYIFYIYAAFWEDQKNKGTHWGPNNWKPSRIKTSSIFGLIRRDTKTRLDIQFIPNVITDLFYNKYSETAVGAGVYFAILGTFFSGGYALTKSGIGLFVGLFAI